MLQVTASCAAIGHVAEMEPEGLVTLVAITMTGQDAGSWLSHKVVTGAWHGTSWSGPSVYASLDSLYVAGTRYQNGMSATVIVGFDLNGGDVRFRAAGRSTGLCILPWGCPQQQAPPVFNCGVPAWPPQMRQPVTPMLCQFQALSLGTC